MPSLAVDLGGTFLRLGVAADSRAVAHVRRVRIPSFLDGIPSESIWESIIADIARYADAAPSLGQSDPIAFAFPGPVVGGRILAAPTVVGNDEKVPDIAAEIEQRTGRPVRLLNDVSAAAWHLSRRLRAERFMVLTVSSGIGSKVFDRRHPAGVLDDVMHAGEIGHCTVDDSPDAALCDCGVRGHLGAVSSGRGVERLARRCAMEDARRFAASRCVTAFGATAETLDNEKHLVPAIREGDDWAVEVLRRATAPLARTLASVAYGIGLSHIAVIGGFALAIGPAYAQMLARYLPRRHGGGIRFLDAADDFVALADLEPDACLLGAAAYAERAEGSAG